MKTVFEERYKSLNKAQREAVDTIEGPVMVIAGPGTGKTSILTLRIANILQKTDTPASGILAITFTESGVKSMRMKLREVIGAKADEVRIHTFHGFAASIISEYPEHFAHISRSKQITDIDAESLVRDILKDKKFTTLRPFGNPDLYLSAIIRTIADSKKEAWTPQMLRSFSKDEIKRIESNEDNISTRGESKGTLKAESLKRIERCEKTALFADVYEAYEAKKKEKKYIDFDDLIIEVILAFEKDELLLRLIQEKFLYVLVDEHQDTNDSQNLLVKMIASFFEEPNLFVVGDEKQAIYRFQGASVDNFLTFQSVWKSMKVISLDTNYRSHQKILDAGFSLIENNYEEDEYANLRIKLASGAKHKVKPIDIVSCGNSKAHDVYLAQKIKDILKADSKSTVALITRTNRDVERLLGVMEEHEIEASAERGADIFSHPFGSLFFDLIEFLYDRSKIEFLARTLAVGLWGVSFETATTLIREIKGGLIAQAEKYIPSLKILSKDLSTLGSIEFLIKVASLSGYTERAIKDPLTSEIWRGIVSLAQDIASKDGLSDARTLIQTLLSYRESAETKTIKISSGQSDAQVTIMTAHGSKGLEYDYVFIPYANEEGWMPRARSSYFVLPKERGEGDSVKDARRLFYVALTRAKLHATILYGVADHMGRELTPLRFIGEIDSKSTTSFEIPAVSSVPHHKDTKKHEEEKLHEFAKHSLMEKGLSVTALNHFMKCPNLFFYKSILRVPEPPSPSSEKGNAMHEAMSRIWMLPTKDEKFITQEIVTVVREYFGKSLLPPYEKDALVEELISDAPIVAKALVSHFSLPGTPRVETWEAFMYKTKIGKEDVEIKLHGKLDALLETESSLKVFDYKTKQAMSVAAIRGETKSDDGGYFRQLIYYKILLGENAKYKGKAIEPSLVFIKPDSKGRCPQITIPVTKTDEERVSGEVKSLIEAVWKGKLLRGRCDDKDCDGCRLKEASL